MAISTQTRTRVRPLELDAVTLGVVGIAAIVVGVLASRHGLRLYSDSAIYLGTARNILHGHGTTSPIALTYTDSFRPDAAVAFHGALPLTTLPPLYSTLLAAIGAFGASLTTAARILGVACLAVASMLVAQLTLRLTGARFVALAAAALFLFGGAVGQGTLQNPGSWVILSASVLSEALFLVLMLATILVLGPLLERGQPAALWAVCVLVALAVLCRYLGVALVATPVVLLLTRRGWPVATRMRRAALVAGAGVVPVALWMLGMRVFVGHGEPLPVRYHPLKGHDVHNGYLNVVRWFVPTTISDGWAIAIVVVGVAAGCALAVQSAVARRATAEREDDAARRPDWTVRAMVVYVGMYLLALLVSHSFLARNITFDARFIAPARPLVYILVITVAYRWLRRFDVFTASGVVVAASALVVVAFLGPVRTVLRDGVVLRSKNPSPTVAAVKHLPRNALIFTNAVETLWGVDGRNALLLPVRWVSESNSFNPHLATDVRQVGDLLQRPNSYVVEFREAFPGTFAPIGELERVAPLEVVGSYADGTIYRRRPA